MSNSDIVASVLAGDAVVNREKKLKLTEDVMLANMKKKAQQRAKYSVSETKEDDRGYGVRGKRMGD